MITHPRTVIVVLVGAHVINDLYATVLPAFLPAVAEEFDLDYTELGVLSFAFVLLTGVLQPLLGNTADRLGRRRWMLVFGFSVGAVGFLAMAAAPSFWFIVAVSLLGGLGAATYHPQATSFIVAAYPETPGRMLGIHGWGGSIGHFLAPGAAVLTIAVLDWRLAMAAIAIPMVVVAVMLRVKLHESPPAPTATLKATITPELLLAAVAFGVIAMVGRSFITFFVKMLVDEGWQETRAGLLLTLLLLAGAVAQPLGGWAFDRIGGRQMIITSSVATAILIAVFATTRGAVSLIAVGGITFFGFMLFPVSMATASQMVPSTEVGGATGVMFGMGGLMTAAAQPAVGALAELVGDIRVALAWLLPVAVLGIVLAYRVPSARHRAAMAA